MKRMRCIMAYLIVIALVFSNFSFAVGGPKDDKDGTDEKMKGFSWMDDKKIILGDQTVQTSLPPVIKEGRTLIPVRAVTEALQAKVAYDAKLGKVTITNKEGTIIIDFYLLPADGGKVIVTENGLASIATPDGKSGRINNSTYVPLRFIAETFGIKVDDSKSGINLNQGPVLVPKQVKYFAEADIPEMVTVTLGLNGYSFKGIKDLAPANYTYDGANTVKLTKAYILSLTAEETKLYFQFQKDSKLELKDFEIELEYKSDSSSVEDKPKLEPDKVENPVGDVKITMMQKGFTFTGIIFKGKPLVAGVDYVIAGEMVTLKNAFIQKQSGKKVDLFFFFEKSGQQANRKFEIEFDED